MNALTSRDTCKPRKESIFEHLGVPTAAQTLILAEMEGPRLVFDSERLLQLGLSTRSCGWMYVYIYMYLYRNIACPPLQRPYETSPNQDDVQQPRCLESTRLQLVRSSGVKRTWAAGTFMTPSMQRTARGL